MTEIVDGLLVAGNEVAKKLEKIKELKVNLIINVSKGKNLFEEDEELEYMRMTIENEMKQTDLERIYRKFYEEVEGRLGKEQRILVHDEAGVNKSVTMVLAYLMQKSELDLEEAYDIVKEKKKICKKVTIDGAFKKSLDSFYYKLM